MSHTPPADDRESPSGEPLAPADEPARILVVGGEPELRTAIVERLRRDGHRCTHMNRLESARSAIARRRFDVVLVHHELPDGDGLALVRLLAEIAPAARAILFGRALPVDTTLAAIRGGAADCIVEMDDLELVAGRVAAALQRSRAERSRELRMRRLQRTCRELSRARRRISEQVEGLCSEVVSAYRDIAERVDDVAMASEFRTLLRQELDVEEVLRTAMEYLLTRSGPTNAAVFLPDRNQVYSLGAYVNYDCPRDTVEPFLEHFCRAICPQFAKEDDLVLFEDADEFAEWVGMEDDGYFVDANVAALACRHEGECLAVVILFRRRSDPYPHALAPVLDTLRTIFAEQLSRLVAVHHRARPQWPLDAQDDDYEDDLDYGFGGGLAA